MIALANCRKTALLCWLTASSTLAACAATPPSEHGDDATLQPCPATPNCVHSDAENLLHAIEPLAVTGHGADTWAALLAYLEQHPQLTVTLQTDTYVRAEARTTLLRFVDDIEFQLRPEKNQIAVRSASRIGFSDLGVNRRRIEAIRKALGRD